MTLEGKLEGVNVGDIVLIQGKQGNAVGYVSDISKNLIALQPRDINNPVKYRSQGDIFLSTSTDYYLEDFETYEVLKKRNQ